ncbi:MAG: SAM-dependent methyltransferase [Isosphaeraceae bacterium]|jgi:SAM-dependent methyltransferase|nr:MAG: SAM-dependent methyltransferase [Isosphaeraceae bacterium]
MPRLPDWLKRPLIPIWNAAHRLAWSASETAEALLRGRFERCAVCGRTGLMRLRRRAIPQRLIALWGLTARQADALVRKETLDCCWCGSRLRGRRIAQAILGEYPVAHVGSLRAWAAHPATQSLQIAEINRIDGLHQILRRHPGFVPSDYEPSRPRGEVRHGVRNEDLTALTYADATFDLLLTSETLEHVPDLERALAEIHRVLKPGGRHIFTVPVQPGAAATFTRAQLRPDGSIVTLVPPLLHHPGGDTGYPVFTEFGADLPELIDRFGFSTTIVFGPLSEDDLAQVYISRRI